MKYCELLYPHASSTPSLILLLKILDLYHALTWPQVSFVAEDHKGRIVGYILAKMYASELC